MPASHRSEPPEIAQAEIATGAWWRLMAFVGIEVRRGIFIEDYLYSISTGGVKVNKVDDLAPVASMPLPDLGDYGYGCYDDGWDEGI